jgi:hypothetical protein
MVFAVLKKIDDTTLKCIYYPKACREKKMIYTDVPNVCDLYGDR